MAKLLTKKDVEHIAKLAGMDLTESGLEKFRSLFNETLDYIQNISEIDTTKVEETSHVTGLENVYRNDVVAPSLTKKEALSNAKSTKDGYFKVPLVLENE